MPYKKIFLFAVFIWGIVFVAASILIAAGLTDKQTLMGIILLILQIALFIYFIRKLNLKTAEQGIITGLIWLIVNFVLEYVVTVRGFMKGDMSLYKRPTVLLGYLAMILIPIILAIKSKNPNPQIPPKVSK